MDNTVKITVDYLQPWTSLGWWWGPRPACPHTEMLMGGHLCASFHSVARFLKYIQYFQYNEMNEFSVSTSVSIWFHTYNLSLRFSAALRNSFLLKKNFSVGVEFTIVSVDERALEVGWHLGTRLVHSLLACKSFTTWQRHVLTGAFDKHICVVSSVVGPKDSGFLQSRVTIKLIRYKVL